MSSYRIETIEGIGASHAKKLAAAGVDTTAKLLATCATQKGRKALAETTGLSDKLILKWTNMADLLRVKGIGEEYSELLEAAGVDTVKELRMRRADNLAKAMKEVNEKKRLVRQVPSESQVERWIAHAKTLPPVMSY
jgi:predicted flap endonuclease-1-like 5' DNA nuclease